MMMQPLGDIRTILLEHVKSCEEHLSRAKAALAAYDADNVAPERTLPAPSEQKPLPPHDAVKVLDKYRQEIIQESASSGVPNMRVGILIILQRYPAGLKPRQVVVELKNLGLDDSAKTFKGQVQNWLQKLVITGDIIRTSAGIYKINHRR